MRNRVRLHPFLLTGLSAAAIASSGAAAAAGNGYTADARASAAGATAAWWSTVSRDLAARPYRASAGAQNAALSSAAVPALFSARGVRFESLLGGTPDTTLPGIHNGGNFGYSVATAGDVNGDGYADVVVVAPYNADLPGQTGIAYVYMGSAAGLSTTPTTTLQYAGNPASGFSVASAGDVNGDGYADVIVGAPMDATATSDPGGGIVYLYMGSAAGLSPTAALTLTSPNQALDGSFGWSVASAGDVNHDGYADVIIGAPFETVDSQLQAGNAYLYLGSATGLSTTPLALSSPGARSGGTFGISVASAGDVNHDGYADLIIGAPGEFSPLRIGGNAYVYLGSASSIPATPSLTLNSPQTVDNGNFGFSVASAGDVNHDGYADVIVGAPFGNANSSGGTAYVYLGSAAGLSTTAATTLNSPSPINTGDVTTSGGFGFSVASIGDINHDGYADIAVGSPRETAGGQSGAGNVYIYLGTISGTSATPFTLSSPSPASGGAFGFSVAAAGDVKGDGAADLIIGADGEPTAGQSMTGKAYVYLGAPALGTPSGLGATAGNAQVSLTWTAASGASSYNVYEGSAAGAESATAALTGVTGTRATISNLSNGTAYYFTVRAVDSGGNTSPASNEASATPQVPAPSAPGQLSATAGNAQVSLNWSAAAGAASYNVYQGSAAGAESAAPVLTGLTTTATTISGLGNGTTYYFTVKAVNPGGTSPASNEASATPQAPASSSSSGGGGGGAFNPAMLLSLAVLGLRRRKRR